MTGRDIFWIVVFAVMVGQFLYSWIRSGLTDLKDDFKRWWEWKRGVAEFLAANPEVAKDKEAMKWQRFGAPTNPWWIVAGIVVVLVILIVVG